MQLIEHHELIARLNSDANVALVMTLDEPAFAAALDLKGIRP